MVSCEATCDQAQLYLIVRDFDRDVFEKREAYLFDCVRTLNEQYGPETVSIEITEQYRNMKEVLQNYPELVADLKRAISDVGLTPVCEPFRGGTDGAALSFRGLPCPNLSAGSEDCPAPTCPQVMKTHTGALNMCRSSPWRRMSRSSCGSAAFSRARRIELIQMPEKTPASGQ